MTIFQTVSTGRPFWTTKLDMQKVHLIETLQIKEREMIQDFQQTFT